MKHIRYDYLIFIVFWFFLVSGGCSYSVQIVLLIALFRQRLLCIFVRLTVCFWLWYKTINTTVMSCDYFKLNAVIEPDSCSGCQGATDNKQLTNGRTIEMPPIGRIRQDKSKRKLFYQHRPSYYDGSLLAKTVFNLTGHVLLKYHLYNFG